MSAYKKLSWEEQNELVTLCKAKLFLDKLKSSLSLDALSKRFGVHRNTIYAYTNNMEYSELTDEEIEAFQKAIREHAHVSNHIGAGNYEELVDGIPRRSR